MSGVKSDGTGGMKMVDNSHLIDPVLKKYLTIAGIDASSLGAEEIEQVKQFAEKENIYEQVERRITVKKEQKRQNKMRGKPPPPPSGKPPGLTPIHEKRPAPSTPAMPGRKPSQPSKAPPSVPPPRKTSSRGTDKKKVLTNSPPPPPSGRGGPPPPPPPAPSPSLSSQPSGPKLPPAPKPKSNQETPRNNDHNAPSRGDLLSQIRDGIKLREVDDSEIERRSTSAKTEGGLMGALTGALAVIHTANFSSDEDDTDDDDNWEDDFDWDD